MDQAAKDWLDNAVIHIHRNLGDNRVQSISPSPAYGCVSVAVIRGDEEFPGLLIQYVPPIKDLSEAASLIRGALDLFDSGLYVEATEMLRIHRQGKP